MDTILRLKQFIYWHNFVKKRSSGLIGSVRNVLKLMMMCMRVATFPLDMAWILSAVNPIQNSIHNRFLFSFSVHNIKNNSVVNIRLRKGRPLDRVLDRVSWI
jgi:hypothetical protein